MGNFKSIIAGIQVFKAKTKGVIEKETEIWYKDNIRLGGTQASKGVVGVPYIRKRSYPHPVLQERRQLVGSIKAVHSVGKTVVSHSVINYRGGKTNADYGKIQNERYGFMRDSKPLTKHIEKKIVLNMKKIFI